MRRDQLGSPLCALIRMAWSASPWYLVVVGGAQLVYAASTPARIIVFRRVLSVLSSGHRGSLVPAVAILGLVLVIGGYVQLLQREKSRLLGELVSRLAVERVLDTTQAANLVLFDDSEFHNRVRRAQEAQFRSSQALTALFGVVGTVLGAVGVLLALTSVSWFLLPAAVVAALPVAFASRLNSQDEYVFMKELMPKERERLYIESLLIDRQPAKEIRAFDLAPFLRSRHANLFDQRVENYRSLAKRRMRRLLLSSLLTSAGTLVIGAALLGLYLVGKMSLTTAGAVAYGFVILGAQLRGLSRGATNLYESLLFMGELDKFVQDFQVAPSANGLASSRPAPAFAGMRVEDVVFTYPTASRPAVHGVSLHLERGELVAFVGPNGSGKTTMAKLIAGLYAPDEGRVFWGGIDAATLEPESRRNHVAIGFQDFERFRMSVADNIGLGQHERRHLRSEILAAADRAGATPFLASLPSGFDTALGPEFEGGCELSQGQWQRLALARVFFRDAALVILDEPTAALDAMAEFELFEAMRRGLEDRCAVVISHRLATVRTADRIYVFDEGRITEVGSHADLIEQGGLYARMFDLQASSYYSDSERAPVGTH